MRMPDFAKGARSDLAIQHVIGGIWYGPAARLQQHGSYLAQTRGWACNHPVYPL